MTSQHRLISGLLIAALVVANAPVLNAQNAPCYEYDENCKSLLKKTAIVGGALVGLIVVWKMIGGSRKSANEKAAQLRAISPPESISVHYRPEDLMGEALYRLEAIPRSNCPGPWTIASVSLASGKLPPSVKLSSGDDGMPGTISGAPDVPGTWTVRILMEGLTCNARNGQSRTYGSLTSQVTINVK